MDGGEVRRGATRPPGAGSRRHLPEGPSSVTVTGGALSAPRELVMLYRLLSIGVNRTPLAARALINAERDCVRIARDLAGSRGPVEPSDVVILRGAGATIGAVRTALEQERKRSPDCLFLGLVAHAGPSGVGLADDTLTWDELAWLMGRVGAERTTAVLSTCHAGAALRPFRVHIGGMGDIAPAWNDVLYASCPGLRLFAAVGPNDVTYDDPAVGGTRFIWAFSRALRCAPGDIHHGGLSFVSDLAVMPRVWRLMHARWPGEPLPFLYGPPPGCGAFPLVLSQAEEPVGAAVVSIAPSYGVAVDVEVHARDRMFVGTAVEVSAFANDGTQLLSQRVPFEPGGTARRFDWTFRVDERRLQQAPSTGFWRRAGLPVPLTWYARVVDDHGHVLDDDLLELVA